MLRLFLNFQILDFCGIYIYVQIVMLVIYRDAKQIDKCDATCQNHALLAR